jgi:hypothetical protein
MSHRESGGLLEAAERRLFVRNMVNILTPATSLQDQENKSAEEKETSGSS